MTDMMIHGAWKHVVQWYGGHGISSPVCEMDVRPGGLWRHVMRNPGGEFATECD